MIPLIFLIALGLHFTYIGGNLFAASRLFRLPHIWALGMAVACSANALQTIGGLVSFAFTFRPQHVALWITINSLFWILIRTGGVVFLCLCLSGHINPPPRFPSNPDH